LPQETTTDDAKASTSKALEAARAWTNYTFSVSTEVEGSFRQGEGEGRNYAPPVTIGKYDKEIGLWIEQEYLSIYKKGDQTAYKTRKGEWKKFTAPSGKRGDSSKREGEGAQRVLRMIQYGSAPMEMLSRLGDRMEEVVRTETKERVQDADCVVYKGKVPEEVLRRLIPAGPFRGAEDMEIEGFALLWIDGDSRLRKCEVNVDIQGSREDEEMTFGMTRTLEFSDVGTTKVEIPEEAKAVVGEAPPIEKKDD
jgi:hypothetical protein